jgi:hypothetical protein
VAKEKWRQVLDTYNAEGLQATFIEQLGWLAPQQQSLKLAVGDEIVTVSVLAQLPGAAVIEVIEEGKPSPQWHKKVDSELRKHFSERLTRFSNSSGDSWYWPKKLASGALSYDRQETMHGKVPDYLAQRLAGLEFTPKDHRTPGKVSPNEVRSRIRGQFESSKVTSDFFKKFKERHEFLKSEIKGLPDDQTASSYSTLILNRLMFVYFLQKKEFLNSDPNYLKNCLHRVQALKGQDKFYSFYRDYLLELFFNRLDSSNGKVKDTAIAEILGDVPYVNGGVFSQSESEKNFNIEIPDQAFERIFEFFDSYVWHLDTRPTGVANEINPEVIGYIFEQYINFTAAGKKENGAYYTTHDVTGFMVSQTVVPRILDAVVSLGVPVFEILQQNPQKYIHETLKHGQINEQGDWREAPRELIDAWKGDPLGWGLLDATPTDIELCLPDESWVEMFYRRERVSRLTADLAEGKSQTVNDLVTLNLSAQALLVDAIDQMDSSKAVDTLWNEVTGLSIIDPTCGSGAFLFAALEVLEDVYAHIADRISELSPKSVVVKEIASHPNLRYFLRKHASIRNLYGTDIMEDAVETAKLRIFLSLASCLESKDQIEPLPDLDFNLKVGNLVVGFKDAEDVSRVDQGRLLIDNKLVNLTPRIQKHLKHHSEFLAASVSNSKELAAIKIELVNSQDSLRLDADSYYAECSGMSPEKFENWSSETKPFHWVIEFPHVIATGGFDVVIGNPPYIRKSEVPKATLDSLIGFKCKGLPDFYAVCVERSLSLLNSSGRISMIVMLSLAFSSSFAELRQIMIRKSGKANWWSTFGKRPDSLFKGVQVRNTIFSMGNGDGFFASRHNIFTPESRKYLFESMEQTPAQIFDDSIPVRGGVSSELLGEMLRRRAPIQAGTEGFYMRTTGQYWFPALPFAPPVLDASQKVISPADEGVKFVPTDFRETPKLAVAALVGKIGFLWWSAIGDDFHCLASQSETPRAFLSELWADDHLKELAQQVEDQGKTVGFASNNAGALYVNIRWTAVRASTDIFDRYVLECLGLIHHWRNLNIWYRQVMRSSGENTNSVALSENFIDKHLSKSSN